jgi:paraquat-inducible protein B
MKSKISPTAIGVFIAGAIVIIFGSVLLFGSGKLFKHTKDYLLTFKEPTTGLEVGAPVKLVGVSVGTVKQVSVAVGGTNDTLLVNVVIEVDRDRIEGLFGHQVLHLDDRTLFEKAVKEQGLRGRLDILSLLSGQLFIALDTYPGQPGFQLNQEDENMLWEIPTLPSQKRELIESLLVSLDNLRQTDLKGAVEDLKALLVDLRTDLAALHLGEAGTNLTGALASVKDLAENPQLKSAITNLNSALAQLDELGKNVNPKINPLLEELSADLKKAGSLFEEANRTFAGLQSQVEPDSALMIELVRTLEEAGSTLNALRQLAGELERNPSALITGKKEPIAQEQIKP